MKGSNGLLTAKEAAKMLSVSARTLWRLTHKGDIKHVRIGRSVRYAPTHIQQFVETHKTTDTNESTDMPRGHYKHKKRRCETCTTTKDQRSFPPDSKTCNLCLGKSGGPRTKKPTKTVKEGADTNCVREFVRMNAKERGNLIALLQLLHESL